MSKKEVAQSTHGKRTDPSLVQQALRGLLVFRPTPPKGSPGDSIPALKLPVRIVEVDSGSRELEAMLKGLRARTLTLAEVRNAVENAALPRAMCKQLLDASGPGSSSAWDDLMHTAHELDQLARLAVRIISRAQNSLLDIEPLTEIHFKFSDAARAVLAVGWEAMAKRGIFPIPPVGERRIQKLREKPCGSMHFVSASDLDAGYFYTMGIAMSPEAQSLKTMEVSYGLDGELIVPGQAVSPIPPYLAMSTRLFAADIPTSSNISEEVQSIPMRNYPHPTSYNDLEPRRGGIYRPRSRFSIVSALLDDLRQQLWRSAQSAPPPSSNSNENLANHSAADPSLPPVKAVIEVTDMDPGQISHLLQGVFKEKDLATKRRGIALYLNIESTCRDRIARINQIVDIAAEFSIKYIAVADDAEDQWLPNLLEYLEPYELNAVADHSDRAGVIVIDGRPVDPIYTAATSAQRIQSVYSTLAVDILKMGMWLCLDALAARTVYRELLKNPHIPQRMLLMPIGIVEPWNAFVDNRNPHRTPRAILDPFEKIKFMIEEAKVLGMPSLLTDTRHKETWVLLGRKTEEDEAHPREDFLRDPITKKIVCRKENSAIPLLSWKEFMECEHLARRAGILLGQAGSVETPQLFQIISETTYDAAKEGRNPATAIWTAETERVLTTRTQTSRSDLQSQRSAKVSPFLAIINRGFESQAKVDGWLRYLEEFSQGAHALREDLESRRAIVGQLLQEMLDVQVSLQTSPGPDPPKHYQQAWDRFRQAYLEYHGLIKQNFLPVRNQVAEVWAVRRKRPDQVAGAPHPPKTHIRSKHHGKAAQ